ncbi:MAG: hypothetical protein ABS35_22720 [Kaistia sp. SCN 65-12]|nr:MAG: hypothetical protein ABS35_22720 [Kaistia sp. SCN 65-12]
MDWIDYVYRTIPIVLSVAALAWTIGSARSKARKEDMALMQRNQHEALAGVSGRIDKLERDLQVDREDGQTSRGEVRERLTEIEARISNMPDMESVHGLALTVSEIRGDVRAQGETLKAVSASSQRVEDFLMRHGR